MIMQQKEERMGANSQLRDRKSCLTIVKFWVNLSLFLGSRLRCTSCAVKDRARRGVPSAPQYHPLLAAEQRGAQLKASQPSLWHQAWA